VLGDSGVTTVDIVGDFVEDPVDSDATMTSGTVPRELIIEALAKGLVAESDLLAAKHGESSL
jgi:hypothetical protein